MIILRYIFALILVVILKNGISQCTVSINSSHSAVHCDTTSILLIASGQGTSNIVFQDDFNTNSTNPNWVTTPNGVYNSVCPNLSSFDGTSFFWIESSCQRIFQTPPLDMTYGGIVSYDIKLADDLQGSGLGCNPLLTEKVFLEYNLDPTNPNSWVQILQHGCGVGSCSFPWTSISQQVPSAGHVNGVSFRLIQELQGCSPIQIQLDNWGIDNFKVEANDPFYFDWTHISSTVVPPGDNDTVTVTQNANTTYQVTFTNNSGISCQDDITINFDPTIIDSVTTTPDSCLGYNDGEMRVYIHGGQADYTYDITGPISQSSTSSNTYDTITSLNAGTYSLTVTDQSGCSVSYSGIVIDPGVNCCNITATSTVTNPDCFGGVGTIDITPDPTTITGSVTYQWYDALTNSPLSGQTNQDLISYPAGNYKVEIIAQCTTYVFAAITEPDELVFTAQSNDEFCTDSNGEIIINSTGGTLPHEFSISGGATYQVNNTFSNLSASNSPFDLIVKDANNCSTSIQTISIIDHPSPVLSSVNSDGPDCFNSATGYIDINATSPSASSLTYSIDNGQAFFSSSSFASLSSGSYDVVVKDANNCESNWSTTIVFANPPELILPPTSTIFTPANCWYNCDGEIDLSQSSGGTGNIQFSINGLSNLGSQSFFDNLCPGLYDILIQDDNGCTVNASDNILDPPPVVNSVNITHPLCLGSTDGQVDFNVTGGTPGYTYYWNSTTISSPITNLPATNGFGDTLVVKDNNNCYDTTFINLVSVSTTPAPVIDNVIVQNQPCFGDTLGTIEIIASGPGTPFTYDIGNGVALSTNNIFDTLLSGNYTIVVTDANNCNSSISNHIISTPPQLNIVLTETPATCYNICDGILDLTMSNGGTAPIEYSFDNGATWLTNGNQDTLCPGPFFLQVRDANGCIASLNNTILDPPDIVIQATPNSPTCVGDSDGSIDFTVTGGNGGNIITWDTSYWNGGTIISGTNISNLSAITDTIWVQDINDCRDSLEVTVVDPPTVIIDSVIVSDITCYGLNNGEINVYTQHADSLEFGNIYTHFLGDDTSFINLSAGLDTIYAYDTQGCWDSVLFTVDMPQELILNQFNDDTICIGDTLILNISATGGTLPHDYFWNGSIENNPFVSYPTDSATYYYFIMDANNCRSDTLSVLIDIYPELSLSLSTYYEDICDGESVSFEAYVSGGSSTGYDYIWSNNLPNQYQHTVTPDTNTMYTVSVNDDCNSPVVSASVTINVHPLPQPDFSISSPEGCGPFEVVFEQLNLDIATTATWNFGDGNISNVTSPVVHTYNNVGTYDVSLQLFNSNNCENLINYPSLITVLNMPVADFIYEPNTPTIINPYVYFDNLSSADATDFHWQIDIGGGILRDYYQENIDPVLYNITGFDTLTSCLYVSNDFVGCVDSICKEIMVRDKFYIYTPNAFTPDGDGVNDVFLPYANGFDPSKFRMYIYDRWGKIMHESFNLSTGWDGTDKNNIQCDVGVYVYKIILDENIDQTSRIYTGNITLVR